MPMGFLNLVPVSIRSVAVVLIAAAALVCLGDLAGPTAVLATGQDCAGCEDQICGQPFQPQASPGFSTPVVAILDVVSLDLAPPSGEAMIVARALATSRWQSVAPLSPRSPPVA